ncbi:hypothetical protein SAMN05444817_103222 [Corynebacterium appendicis CIP 107643]|uniref:Cupin domain-containing protein n=1 Tax=Corynebacterium appendicis CIP 107643 TaxID=1161099 RepID=A0A1N7J356_9CORY|nr:XRE family transcriptional regulator [Corynebacterium appendicis]WJY61350.1 hypothetical protein CAPP_07190 [Corynebacterium appendicis CIP 107643]SIS43651.1 hypothetical protein SAMN05444817_103222 [Corynebacterium appendicis CIP 107643]
MQIIEGLQAAKSADNQQRDRPQLKVLGKHEGATVVRLSFAAGDVMPDHKAAWPILVIGQTGRVEFSAEGETQVVEPGSAVHLGAGIVHELVAREDATVTLVILSESHQA